MAACLSIQKMSVDQLCDYLAKHLVDITDVLENIRIHKIDGAAFLQLNEEYLREVAPLLGDRIKLKSVVSNAHEPPSPVATPENSSDNLDISAFGSGENDIFEDSSAKHDDSSSVGTSVESDPYWPDKIKIPTRFSKATTVALKSGNTLMPTSRDEIVNSLATVILLECSRPTAQQLEKVASRLIAVHPTLADKLSSGIPYASWKRKLVGKFKNLNRQERAQRLGLIDSDVSDGPPTKKSKTADDSQSAPSCSEQEEYARNKAKLKQVYESNKWILSSIKSLIKETSNSRRHWICTECPPVELIISEFPCLKEPQLLIYDFQQYLGLNECKLLHNCRRIIAYAGSSTKKEVKALVRNFHSISSATEDHVVLFGVSIAALLVTQRGRSKPLLLFPFQGDHIDVSAAIERIEVNHPIILFFGPDIQKATQPMVVIERTNVLKMPSFLLAVTSCVASYYVFNIQYHASSKFLCLLLEYMCGVDIETGKLPLSVQQVIEGLA